MTCSRLSLWSVAPPAEKAPVYGLERLQRVRSGDSGSRVGNKLAGAAFCARVADASQETSANQWRPPRSLGPALARHRLVVLSVALRTGAKEAG